MKQFVILKNRRKRVIVCCPLFRLPVAGGLLGWLFAVFYVACTPFKCFADPAFMQEQMPLEQMVRLILQQIPFVGTRMVHRTVCIPVKNHLIYVNVRAAAWIRDYRILTALAVRELNNSRELKNLPRWMRKEIRKKAKGTQIVSTHAAYGDVRCYSITDVLLSQDAFMPIQTLICSLEMVCVSRCIIWKGSAAAARSITARDLVPRDELKANIDLLADMHPICLELAVRLYQKNYWLSVPAIRLMISLERRYTCFFYTTAGSRLLTMIYAGVGLFRILRRTGKEICLLGGLVGRFWQGSETPVSLMYAVENYGMDPSLNLLLPENALTDTQPVLADDPCLNSAAAAYFIGNRSDEPGKTGRETMHDDPSGLSVPNVSCCCTENCRHQRNPEAALKMKPAGRVSAFQEDGVSSPEQSVSKTDSTTVRSDADNSKNGSTSFSEREYEIFQAMLAAAYCRATGAEKAPVFVLCAEPHRKTSGARKHINRYHGKTPALSIEALFKVFNAMYPGCYITDFVPAEKKGDKDTIYLHTSCTEITCPHCGKKAKKRKDAETRTVQDLSLRNGVGVELKLTLGRACCENPECSNHETCFSEPCSFAPKGRRHTSRVEYLALITGISSSFHDSERQMKLLGITYGDDNIKKLLDSLQFRDETDVKVIGLDDVSIRKGQSYCTIIYNMANGHMLKLIKGRSGSEFQKQLHLWLDQHPHVVTVCRDRSAAYGCYIDRYCLLHPERSIRQVADRFHLLQNLSDHLYKAYNHKVPNLIALSVGKDGKAVLLDRIPNQRIVAIGQKPKGMENWQYDNTVPTDEAGNPVLFDVYVDRMPDRKKIEKLEQGKEKYEKICRIRKEYEALGCKFARGEKKKFLEKHGISSYRFNEYISMSEEALDALRRTWKPASRPKDFDNYKNLVYKMLRDGHDIPDAFWYIKEVAGGWEKSDNTLMDYIRETYILVHPDKPLPLMEELVRKEYQNGELVIGRQRLFYALMTLDEKKQDKDLAPHLDMICKKYPVCQTIRDTFRDFHDIIIVDRDINKRTPEKCEKALAELEAFISKHQDDELSGFASSLKGDIKCVSNAITMRENSGGVEGRNCKYKQYLRTCYGHIETETLEQKLKLGFMYTGPGFSLAEIAPWLVQDLPA